MAETASIHLPQAVAPLESVLDSPARLQTARMLSRLPQKEFTGRELARLLGLSHSSVQDAMRVHVNKGIALQRIVGRSHIYRANTASFLYRTLSSLFRKEESIGRDVVNQIRRALESTSIACVIFGSSARGDAGDNSDLDVLVVVDDRTALDDELFKLSVSVLRRYGIRIDAKVVTRSELREKGRDPYLRAALAEGVRISGEPLERVMKAGQDG